MDDSVVFARMCQREHPSNTCFLGPTRVYIANGISVGSAVFVGLSIVTDRPTDHTTTNNVRISVPP